MMWPGCGDETVSVVVPRILRHTGSCSPPRRGNVAQMSQWDVIYSLCVYTVHIRVYMQSNRRSHVPYARTNVHTRCLYGCTNKCVIVHINANIRAYVRVYVHM